MLHLPKLAQLPHLAVASSYSSVGVMGDIGRCGMGTLGLVLGSLADTHRPYSPRMSAMLMVPPRPGPATPVYFSQPYFANSPTLATKNNMMKTLSSQQDVSRKMQEEAEYKA